MQREKYSFLRDHSRGTLSGLKSPRKRYPAERLSATGLGSADPMFYPSLFLMIVDSFMMLIS
jgi:hypothetical protein